MSMHYIEKMGPDLFREVERQLLEDLEHYGVSGKGLQTEWWKTCGEGHCTVALSGRLEEVSSLVVLDKDHNLVAEGWMDFIHGGGDDPLFVFWLYLSIREGNEWRKVKDKPTIPAHIWGRLSEQERHRCAQDYRWRRDPTVHEWLAEQADMVPTRSEG